MALSDDIRQKAGELLTQKIDLDQFEEWIASESWDVHRDEDAVAAAPLAYKIQLLLSELSGGYRDEDEFLGSLARVFQDDWASSFTIRATPTLVEVLQERVVGSAVRTERVGAHS